MQFSKVSIVIAIFTLASIDASSITIQQNGNSIVAFEVEYSYNGKNLTEFSGNFSSGQQKTIDIPDKAVDLHLKVCSAGQNRCKNVIFTKFYHSPASKCFTLSANNQYKEEANCHQRPAGGYSITVHQAGDYKTVFEVNYKYNGKSLTNSSGELSTGRNKTIQIPDNATNINLALYGYKVSKFSKESMFTKFYPTPVKKCFQTYGEGFFSKSWFWFEKPCEKLPATLGYSITVRQTEDRQVQLNVTYNYDGTEFTELSDLFSKGQTKTIPIPDRAANIKVTLNKKGIMKMETVFSLSYPSPVKKCFKSEATFVFNKYSEERC